MDNQYFQCTIFATARKFLPRVVVGRTPGQPIDMIHVCGSAPNDYKNNNVEYEHSYRESRDMSKSQLEGFVGALE
jgi:hypothetical protein